MPRKKQTARTQHLKYARVCKATSSRFKPSGNSETAEETVVNMMLEEGSQVTVNASKTKMSMDLDTKLPRDSLKNSLSARTWKSLQEWLQKHFFPNQQNNMAYMSILLYVGGVELLAYVKSRAKLFAASNSTKMNEVELLSLISHVEESSLRQVFLLYERHKFFSKTQDKEESVCEFVNDIKVMAKYCDFQENKDQIVASRIRNGLFKDSERQQLENVSDSDLIKLPLCELLNLNSSGSQSYQCPVHKIRSKVPKDASAEEKPFIVTIITQNKTETMKTQTRPVKEKEKYSNESKQIMTEQVTHTLEATHDDRLLNKDTFTSVISVNCLTMEEESSKYTDLDTMLNHHLSETVEVGDRSEVCEKNNAAEIDSEMGKKGQDASSSSTLETPRGGLESWNIERKEETVNLDTEIEKDCAVMDGEHDDLTGGVEETCSHEKIGGETFDAGTGIITTNDEEQLFVENKMNNKIDEGHDAPLEFYIQQSREIEEPMNEDLKVKKDRTIVIYGENNASISNISERDLTNNKKLVRNKKEDSYKCLIYDCGRLFATSKQLKCHIMESHLEIEMLKCEICSESHPNLGSLVTHRKLMHSDIFFSFHCDVCQVGFHHKRKMELHKLKAHTYNGQDIIICKYCHKTFPDSKTYEEHEKQSHSGDRKYSCDVCSKQFKHPYKLDQHKMRKHNTPKPYMCEVCGASFVSMTDIIEHRLIHIKNEKPFECLDCGQSFRIKNTLRNHLLSHVDDRPFICELCGNSFKSQTQLKFHDRWHKKLKSHVCDVCGAAYFRSCDLQYHKLKHTGERPYKCHICQKTFILSKILKKHIRIVHEGLKPVKKFSCQICGHLVPSLADLKVHTLKHTGERPFACLQCDASFTRRTQLNIHKRKHTGEKPFSCSECDVSFFSSDCLKKHKLNKHEPKQHKCRVCGKAFATATILRRHEIYHQPKKYKCDKCTKAFSCPQNFEKHKLVHSGLKPNKCQLCSKAFNTLFSARRHLKLIHKIENPSLITVD